MLRSKKALSGIVVAIIMIALVLVAAGILWAIIGNLLDRQSDAITASDLCTGIIINIESAEWDDTDPAVVNVVLRRSRISTPAKISEFLATLDVSEQQWEESGDISSSKSGEITGIPADDDPTNVKLIWFVKPEGEDKSIPCQGSVIKDITGTRAP